MRQLKYLLQKEFLQIRRDKIILKMILGLPVIQLLILPWAATFEQRNISLGVIDNDRGSYSRQLIDKVISSGFFRLTDYSDSYDQALKAIESDKADLILEIPAHFEDHFVRHQQTDVMLSVNAVNGQKAGLGAAYIGQIIAEFNQNIILEQGVPLNQINLIRTTPYFKYNKEMNYRNFMVPGILVMLLTLIGGVLSAMNIVKEKELGTIEQINVTPVPKFIFILAKLIPFIIIGLVLLTTGLSIAWLVYELFPAGNVLLIYLFAFFYLIAFTGAGLVISTYSNTQQQAMFVAIFFMIIFFLLSGLFTPVSSMPQWAQTITLFNPLRYFVEVIRLIFMKGSQLTDILPQLGAIIGFGIFFNTWAIVNYKKTG
ncbi:MAG: ABC transporter permease [Dysgonamonadaceae bacterium]|jgi:ABC-2 type transport system permease protein|nr:ABC transporter permease [Dysgonamonadaceae bacterium]